jgi:hypothetical protein
MENDSMIKRKFITGLAVISSLLLGGLPALSVAEVDVGMRGDNTRTDIKQISAVITEIDAKSREITLEGELGNLLTITAGPEIARFDEFKVGDIVTATYASSVSGELREPTEAELAAPMVALDEAAIAASDMPPGAAVGQAVRAVCTIEGMNRVTRTVMLKDPDGDFHIIGDVDPAKMEGVILGQTVVVTYTQALALTLEKQAPQS